MKKTPSFTNNKMIYNFQKENFANSSIKVPNKFYAILMGVLIKIDQKSTNDAQNGKI